MKLTVSTIIFLSFLACNTNPEQNTQGKWIKGTEAQKLETIEKQFRGFDNTMVETGYRYQELYWAGKEQNWEYADYQLQKFNWLLKTDWSADPKEPNQQNTF